jgi:hypothetical protein
LPLSQSDCEQSQTSRTRRAHGLCDKEEVRHTPAAASWQVQNPGDFLAWHFPKPVFLEAAPLLVSFEVLHEKKLPEDRI